MNKIMEFFENYDGQPVDIWVRPEVLNQTFDQMVSVQQLEANGRLRVMMKDGTRIEVDLGAGKLLGEGGKILSYAKLVRYNTVELPGSDRDYVLI